jgi:hypothetical protein
LPPTTIQQYYLPSFSVYLIGEITDNKLNSVFTSPTYFCTSSEPMTLMKQASVRLATALAHNVFPVPGGPNSKTPFGGSIPRLTKRSGCKEKFSDTCITKTGSSGLSVAVHDAVTLYKLDQYPSQTSLHL